MDSHDDKHHNINTFNYLKNYLPSLKNEFNLKSKNFLSIHFG